MITLYNKQLILVFILCSEIFFIGCSNGNEPDTIVAPKVNSTTYAGKLNAYDEFGKEIDDKSGFEISIINSNPVIKGISTNEEYYQVNNVPEGRHRFQISKAGFGSYKTIEYNMTNVSAPYLNYGTTFMLGQVSTSVISNIEANIEGEKIKISGITTPAGTSAQPRSRELFFSKDPNVSLTNHQLAIGTLGTITSSFNDNLNSSDLKSRGFSSGDKIYLVIHGNNVKASSYIDPVTKVSVYPALNNTSSNVISFILP